MRKDFDQVLECAFRHTAIHLKQLDDRPVGPTVSLDELRSRFSKTWNSAGRSPNEVIAELIRDVTGALNNSTNARFFGWVNGGSLPSGLAADWLTAAWDQNAGMYAVAPAAAVVEETVGMWLKELFRLPQQASFALTTGCQMAHTTCLAAARHWLLKKQGWDVERQGMAGSPPITIFCGGRHATIDRAIKLLGFGENSIRALSTDMLGKLDAQATERALREFSGPAILLLQAGDVNTGSFDEFEQLIPLARRYGAWTHVDGAFGMWVVASPRYEHLVRDMEEAHSWATDGHKWLNVPYDCGYAFVAEPEAHRAAMSHHASYLPHQAEVRDPIDWNPEFSRRARGFASYAALEEFGRDGVREMIERTCECAAKMVSGFSGMENVEILTHPLINQGLVAFLDPAGKPNDAWNDRVISEIASEGTAFFSGTTWRGRRAMRISVSNWQTSSEDVDLTLAAVRRVLARLHQVAMSTEISS